jgi:hypothetical protein
MRESLLVAVVVAGVWSGFAVAQPDPKQPPKAPEKPTAAAELTRTKLLKVKVSGEFKDVRLGDILKAFAGVVEMNAEGVLMWTYGPGFPYSQKVTYSCKNKTLEAALDELCTKVGALGYVVVSKEGDKYDGWVRLTTTGERGYEKGAEPKATAEDEEAAAKRLAVAKKLYDAQKFADAKPLLEFIAAKYPGTKAAAEAKELLGKIK